MQKKKISTFGFDLDIIQQLQGTERSKANPADVSVSTNDDSSSFLKTSEDCTSDFLKGIASNTYQVGCFPFRYRN